MVEYTENIILLLYYKSALVQTTQAIPTDSDHKFNYIPYLFDLFLPKTISQKEKS